MLGAISGVSALVRADESFPTILQLPPGFRPEGLTHGRGDTLYVNNFDHGAIFKVNAETGVGEILVPASETRQGIGLRFDRRTNLLYSSGGTTGHGFVFHADTGALVADYVLATGSDPTFINDGFITPDAIVFTDSLRPTIYRLPLGEDARPGPQSAITTITLNGDMPFIPGAINANDLENTPDHEKLIVDHSTTGNLYTLDVASGHTDLIDLGGVTLPTNDGMWLQGRILYVAQNTNNVAVIELSKDGARGRVVRNITSLLFDALATPIIFADGLYLTNARFEVQPADNASFTVVRIGLHR
jgi:hypothetical protein